ncbi:AmmeMemoRadiSam system protein A [Tibeticola sp.]|uniref:AmmeMemoRadiSam system protein A n=1 Tax=Tibeticola sp. TaxID=2005368 RepID=UPI00258BA0DF|nr:AmmeMemoRadiSam system protein A [Tibeticola sp.]MCI4441306.1 AmmeMemoRadiSam system protein A [Tibeticola sp.]
MSHPATPELGRALLRLARAAIERALGMPGHALPPFPEAVEAALDAPGATFVTLTQRGALRGCIGSLVAHRRLREDVQANAVAAALEDPRFAPLSVDELPRTEVEVSLLSPPQPIPVHSRAEALRALRPGVDGVIFSWGPYRSTFLPQVWEQLSEPEVFLQHLVAKAGLPPDFWDTGVRLQRYTVEKWRESDVESGSEKRTDV